jgi:hypothetical protein
LLAEKGSRQAASDTVAGESLPEERGCGQSEHEREHEPHEVPSVALDGELFQIGHAMRDHACGVAPRQFVA